MSKKTRYLYLYKGFEMAYIVEELVGNDSYPLETFEERDEAEHFMIECSGNDVTNEYGEDILLNDEEYMRALENALSYYAIIESK